MAGPPGQSGQSAQSLVVQELSKGVVHVMQPVTPALDLLFRPASAAWSNVIVAVRIFLFFYFFLGLSPISQFSFKYVISNDKHFSAMILSQAMEASTNYTMIKKTPPKTVFYIRWVYCA